MAALFVGAEFVFRWQNARSLDARISDLEKIVRTNATYNRALFAGYEGREKEATDHFTAFPGIPTIYRPFIEWRRLPNFRGGGIQLNSLGYRGPEFSVAKPEGTFRVLLYGGSFVWGTGALNSQETIAGHLEEILNQNGAGQRYEVINCGETGFNSTQETIFLQLEGLFLSPNLVVFIDGVNDTWNGYKGYPAGFPQMFERLNKLLTGQVRRREESTYTVEDELAHLKRQREVVWDSSYSETWERILNLGQSLSHLKADYRHDFTTPEEFALRHYTNLRIIRSLGKEFDFASSFAVQPVPVLFKPLHPQEEQHLATYRNESADHRLALEWWKDHYNEYVQILEDLCRSSGLELIDLRKVFEDDERPFYIDTSHLTGDGYRIVAERLAQSLKQRNLVP